jgi:hypothetical protein
LDECARLVEDLRAEIADVHQQLGDDPDSRDLRLVVDALDEAVWRVAILHEDLRRSLELRTGATGSA